MTHANRSRRTRATNLWANPTPDMIKDARERLGLTETEAAAVVFRNAASWRAWEAGERRMGPGDWVLFRVRTRLLPIDIIMEDSWHGPTEQHDQS
jgi:DNA-binding transcriptional regulator YiaG